VTTSPKFAAILATLLLSLSTIAAAQLKIGSGNTALADPPVPRPHTQPCTVTLYKGFKFADFNPRASLYTGPRIVRALGPKLFSKPTSPSTRVASTTARPTSGSAPPTSTSAPPPSPRTMLRAIGTSSATSPTTVSIFTLPQDGTVDLGNLVDKTYTGILHGSADILFYPLERNQLPPRTADQVIAFSSGPTGGTVGLNTTTDLLEQTLTLPTNITDAYLDVFAQSQSNDEFWYTCVPNDVAGELFSCGGTAFRESEVTIDGTPAGVAPVYPGSTPVASILISGVPSPASRP